MDPHPLNERGYGAVRGVANGSILLGIPESWLAPTRNRAASARTLLSDTKQL